MRKKGFTMIELIAIIVIMASMLLIILPAVNNTIRNSEERKKEEDLNNIYMAAENYLMANYDEYKIDNAGDTTYIYITDLVSNDYMSIDTLNPNNDASFSNRDVVKITRNDDGTFSYELDYLKTLIETLLEQYNSSNTVGLLRDSVNENLYYYKGTNEEVSNNYLWYGGHHWRVMEFDVSENTLLLISQMPLTSISPARTVWTTEEEYELSYINNWLNEYFWDSLDNDIQNNILDNTFNIGIYGDTKETQNISEITTVKKIGLIDAEQYLRSGEEDSYLDTKNMIWTGNRNNISGLVYISNGGYLELDGTDSTAGAEGVRPVIRISDVIITEGNGTLNSNYETGKIATSTTNIQVGEYINVPYNGSDNACGDNNKCTFRVVSKDNDSIKIVLNGLLNKTSKYGLPATITTEHVIYEPLKDFVNNIDDSYKYSGNKKFYIGYYPHPDSDDEQIGYDYNNIKNEYLETNVGLVTIGEMFSSDDIDLSTSSTKEFVDVNTIENPTISNWYWTMNRYGGDPFNDYFAMIGAVHIIYQSGTAGGNLWPLDDPEHEDSYDLGVRPTLYLKNNLTFTGGDGTAQNPYTLD